MNCVECERREVCNECKSLELDKLDEGIKFSCYKFKPIMKDNEIIKALECCVLNECGTDFKTSILRRKHEDLG